MSRYFSYLGNIIFFKTDQAIADHIWWSPGGDAKQILRYWTSELKMILWEWHAPHKTHLWWWLFSSSAGRILLILCAPVVNNRLMEARRVHCEKFKAAAVGAWYLSAAPLMCFLGWSKSRLSLRPAAVETSVIHLTQQIKGDYSSDCWMAVTARRGEHVWESLQDQHPGEIYLSRW